MSLFSRMSRDLLLREIDLKRIARTAPYRYKVFEIPKRAGGTRIIAQPAREVKPLQRWLMDHLLARFPVHECAMAYVRGKSIRTNAEAHAASSHLLKLDFRNFFPSIVPEDFQYVLGKTLPLELTSDEIDLVSRILFRHDRKNDEICLSIGAPSSPMVSNILMYEFDSAIAQWAIGEGVRYTRYADDLSFSADSFDKLQRAESRVTQLLESTIHPVLRLHPEKTVYASKARKRQITGLVLANDGSVSLGRDKKRAIRAMVHKALTARLEERDVARVSGMLAFAWGIEKGFVFRLRDKYGDRVFSLFPKNDLLDGLPHLDGSE